MNTKTPVRTVKTTRRVYIKSRADLSRLLYSTASHCGAWITKHCGEPCTTYAAVYHAVERGIVRGIVTVDQAGRFVSFE